VEKLDAANRLVEREAERAREELRRVHRAMTRDLETSRRNHEEKVRVLTKGPPYHAASKLKPRYSTTT
jgi:hypothetical protein